MKKVIICIHGFKTGPYHDFDLFEKYCLDNPGVFDGEIFKVVLYQMDDRKSYNYKKWKKVVMSQIEQYLSDEYSIYLIGYSMGAGVACYVASKVKVAKLILIAPIFNLFGSNLFLHNIKLFLKSLKMRLFQRKKLKRLKRIRRMQKKVVPFWLTFNVALSIKKYKKYPKKVRCESLVMLGLEDNYTSLRSAHYAFKKIKSKKKELWFIDHLNHLFIFSKELAPEVFVRIIDFIQGATIIPYIR